MDITYKIEFFSEWHCGSGLSAGADTDALVIKDSEGFPYIPGKTLKGLFREAIEELIELKDTSTEIEKKAFKNSFGYFSDNKAEGKKGSIFFTNAELELKEQIKQAKAQCYLFRRITSTAIDNGVAEANSLRSMETVVPCTLTGEILDIDDSLETLMKDSAMFIKRLGQNRNRGLGRCDIKITAIENKKGTAHTENKEEQA